MNWFICNVCLRRPLNGVKSYSLTSCFHILCDSCISHGACVCTKCKQKCAIIQLNSKTPSSIRRLFVDVTNRTRNLKKMLKLQSYHRTHLLSYYSNLSKKYKKIKEVLITNEKNANLLYQKYQKNKNSYDLMKRKLLVYEEQLRKYHNSQIHQYHHYPSYGDPLVKSRVKEKDLTQTVTPRGNFLNGNSSVFISPESIASKTSSKSGGSTDDIATPGSL